MLSLLLVDDCVSTFSLPRILLVWLLIFPAWVLACRRFIKPIQMANPYRAQKYYRAAQISEYNLLNPVLFVCKRFRAEHFLLDNQLGGSSLGEEILPT